MILAAGLGTRLKNLTADRPKALVEVGGKSLLEWNLLHLKAQGFDRFVVNIHHFGEQVIAFLVEKAFFGCQIEISDERDQLMETGGGIWKASSLLQGAEPFLVHNVDVLSTINLQEMMAFHKSHHAMATLAVLPRDTDRAFLFSPEGMLAGWRNRKTQEKVIVRDQVEEPLPLAFCGIQILEPSVFLHYSAQGPFSVVDAYLSLARQFPVKAYVPNGTRWLDVGKAEEMSKAEEFVSSWS